MGRPEGAERPVGMMPRRLAHVARPAAISGGGESGVVEWIVAFGVGFVLVGGMVVLATAQALTSNSTVAGGRLPPPPSAVYFGPDLSSDKEIADCQKTVGSRNSLIWTGADKGWRQPRDFPEPELVADPQKNKTNLLRWVEQLRGYIATVQADWADCFRGPQTPPAAKPRPKPSITGSFNVEYEVSGPCRQFSPMILTFTESPFVLYYPLDQGRPGDARGLLDPATFEFRATFETEAGQDQYHFGGGELLFGRVAFEFRGGFDVDADGRSIIRNGVGELQTNGKTCPFTFRGKRAS